MKKTSVRCPKCLGKGYFMLDGLKIGKKLQLLRESQGLSRTKAALGITALGISMSAQTLFNIERGKYKSPAIDKIIKILNFYGQNLSFIEE